MTSGSIGEQIGRLRIWKGAYYAAHTPWYFLAGIGFAAFFCLLLFKRITNWADRKQERMGETGWGPPNGVLDKAKPPGYRQH